MSKTYKFKCFQCGQEFTGADAYKEHLRSVHGAPDKFVKVSLYVDMWYFTARWYTDDDRCGIGELESFCDGHDGGEPSVRCDTYLDLDNDCQCISVEARFPEWGETRKQRTIAYAAEHLEPVRAKMRIRALNALYGYLAKLRQLPRDVRNQKPVLFDSTAGKFLEMCYDE